MRCAAVPLANAGLRGEDVRGYVDAVAVLMKELNEGSSMAIVVPCGPLDVAVLMKELNEGSRYATPIPHSRRKLQCS